MSGYKRSDFRLVFCLQTISCITVFTIYVTYLFAGVEAFLLMLPACAIEIFFAQIYPCVFWGKFVKEIKRENYDSSKLLDYKYGILLSIITAGIYYIYYIYSVAQIVENIGGNQTPYRICGKVMMWYGFSPLLGGVGIAIAHHIIMDTFNNKLCPREEVKLTENNHKRIGIGQLECISGELKNGVVKMEHNSDIIIGRDPKVCSLVIKNPKVSRKHCRVHYDGYTGTFILKNYSSNGTRLQNTKKMFPNEKMRLNSGSIFEISDKDKFIVR